MYRRKVLFSALLFCSAGLVAFGQDSSFMVEVKPTRTTVKCTESFRVSTAIRNNSNEEKSLNVWSCSYSTQWSSDNPVVRIDGADCMKNGLGTVRLKPGEAYERELWIHVEPFAGTCQHESITFRLRFEDGNRRTAPKISPIWSNAVTVRVTNDGNSGAAARTKSNLPADPGSGTGGVTITHVCETTSYNPKPAGVPASRLTFLEGNKVSTTSSILVYNTSSQTYDGTLTIKNVGIRSIVGPFRIVLDSLTEGVTLANSTSTFSCWPYITVPDADSLEPGRSASVNLQFSNPKNATIKYVPMVYSGSFD